MKLKFRHQRLALIKRLRSLSFKDIIDKMNEYNQSKRRLEHPVDRWADGHISPREEQLPALCYACGVPLGFFFYNELRISVAPHPPHEMQVFICETQEVFHVQLLG